MLDRARVALVLFTLHNCTAALLMRYTQLHNRDYSSAVAVLLQETAVKLPCIIILFLMEAGGTPSRALLALRDDGSRWKVSAERAPSGRRASTA